VHGPERRGQVQTAFKTYKVHALVCFLLQPKITLNSLFIAQKNAIYCAFCVPNTYPNGYYGDPFEQGSQQQFVTGSPDETGIVGATATTTIHSLKPITCLLSGPIALTPRSFLRLWQALLTGHFVNCAEHLARAS
jgi:hypothetical protein